MDKMKFTLAIFLALSVPTHAAVLTGYQMITCAEMPYPYDARCNYHGPVHTDADLCQADADDFNQRLGPHSIQHATCNQFIVDCSMRPLAVEEQIICGMAMQGIHR